MGEGDSCRVILGAVITAQPASTRMVSHSRSDLCLKRVSVSIAVAAVRAPRHGQSPLFRHLQCFLEDGNTCLPCPCGVRLTLVT